MAKLALVSSIGRLSAGYTLVRRLRRRGDLGAWGD